MVSNSPRPRGRLWEVDSARGAAVVAMVFFHLMWNLQFLGLTTVNIFSAPWQIFARSIGSSFAFLMGLSLTLAGARLRTLRGLWRYTLRRGTLVFGLGMLITLVTFVALGDQFVRFGILHLLGAMMLIATPFVFIPLWRVLTFGLLMIVLGALLSGQSVAGPWLLWLGIPPDGVQMADYYPLLPWGGPVLLGVAYGRLAYPEGKRHFLLPDLSSMAVVRALRLFGRHSLPIYLLHQPILLGALLAFQALR